MNGQDSREKGRTEDMAAASSVAILGVHDVRASADWFCASLGFTLDPDTGLFDGVDEAEGAVYGIVTFDGAPVHLQIRRRPVFASDRDEVETDAYLYVDDVDAVFARHQAAGVTIHRPIYDEPYGMRDYCIETPDGHRIAFGSPVPATGGQD